MKNQKERISVKIADIEQMILMADKVVDEVMMGGICRYDENGVPHGGGALSEQMNKDRADGTDVLVYKTIHEKYEHLEDVLKISAAELAEKLTSIKRRVLGIFRSGILEEWYRFEYYADESVPDEWLFTMFLMRVRDRMIVFGVQRRHDEKEQRKASKKEDL